MTKRGQNEGSIYYEESRKRWVGAITLDDGKRRRVVGASKKIVQEKMTALLRDQQTGMLSTGPRQTVEAYLNHWLKNVAQQNVRVRTYDRYACLIRLHVVPYVGKKQLDKLSGQDLQALYGRLGAPTLNAKGLAPRTVGHVHRCLHKAIEDAFKLGLVPRNVCDMVSPPKAPTPHRAFFTQEQARAFLAAIKGHRLEGLFTVVLLCGLRQGELFALKWNDVQLDARTLSVRRTVYFRKGHGVVWSEPKSASSTRRIDLDPVAIAALRRHKATQAQERLFAGSKWQDDDLVFANTLGGPMRAGNFLYQVFYPLLEKAGFPHIRFHDLRHSCASLLLELGVQPKVVQELLGHSSIGITMDTYSHVMPNMQRDALDLLGKAIGG